MAELLPKFIETREIPLSLWDPENDSNEKAPKGELSLPEILGDAYRDALNLFGLMETAMIEEKRREREIGGISKEASEEHFAVRYSGSCARTQLFYLDPHLTFKTTREDLIRLFSGGEISILDIPSGAGSGSASLISLVAQLRKDKALPILPLKIHVTGGDISDTSIKISRRIFSSLIPQWKQLGIEVYSKFIKWDIMEGESTVELVELWSKKSGDNQRVLLGNNFSGFLATPVKEGSSQKMIDEANANLSIIFATAAAKCSQVFWLEPCDKPSEKIIPALQKLFARYTRIEPVCDETRKSSSSICDPVIDDYQFTVRATGLHLKPKS